MRKRAKHGLSNYRMHTAEMGELIPIGLVPVLPGDTLQHSTSALVRVSPLNTPVMHPVTVRIHSFFVPNRILWPESENGGWEQFITGGPDGMNQQKVPTVQLPIGTNKKAVTAYLGVPPNTNVALDVNALPLRAYNAIFNEWYRDQDVGPVRAADNNALANITWEKDYFTTSRPWAQKGPSVTLPLGQSADIKSDAAGSANISVKNSSDNPVGLLSDTSQVRMSGVAANEADKLYADLSTANQIDVNDFRAAFSIQRYQEARARYGSRFTEYLRYLGITPSDARLQLPEFLGGGSTRLNFSEVLQTTPGQPGEAGVGDLYGHGIAGVRSNAYRKFFEEHGYVVTVMSVRPKAVYLNGVHREWLKEVKEDYFQKELANLGQQEVYRGELFVDGGDRFVTFGWQDRYDEYRQQWSYIGQDFRDTLNSWHLGRDLPSGTTLNNAFLNCVPDKRIFQVTTGDPLWIMANHRCVARRMVPRRANPRII